MSEILRESDMNEFEKNAEEAAARYAAKHKPVLDYMDIPDEVSQQLLTNAFEAGAMWGNQIQIASSNRVELVGKPSPFPV